MKKLIMAIVVGIIGVADLSAQETYSVAATAPQVTRLTKGIAVSNVMTCGVWRLAATCTQAQACTAAAAVGGAACTAAQARAANARIFPATLAGREEFLIFVLVAGGITDLQNRAIAFDQQNFCAAFKVATVATQNTACTTLGLAAGCEPCS